MVLAQEEDFWADHRSSVDGLNEYLRAFPVGTHHDEARERLRVFEQARAQQEAERRVAAEAERVRRETELREASARQRLWMRTQFNRWVRLFGGLNGWGQGMGPIVEGNPDFGAAFKTTRRSAARPTAARTTTSISTSPCRAARPCHAASGLRSTWCAWAPTAW